MQGSYAPCQRIFMALYNDPPVFKQGEMGAKKVKRQNFFTQWFCLFYYYLILNRY